MDKRIIAAIAVVVIVIIGAVAALVLIEGESNPGVKFDADTTVDSGTEIGSFEEAISEGKLKGKTLAVGIKTAAGSNVAEITINKFAMDDLADNECTLQFIVNGVAFTVSKADVKAVADANDNVTFKLSSDLNSAARAMANVDIEGTKKIDSVDVTVAYKANTKDKESEKTVVSWNGKLETGSATYSNGVATFPVKANDKGFLAFMTAEDAAYYPVTFTTMISNNPVVQTLTHRPTSVVTLWDSSTELGILFGLYDIITYAYASPDYICLNADLQPLYDKLDTKKVYDSGITTSIEEIRAAEPDLIIGWASSFVEGAWGVGLPAEWNDRGTAVMACNRPSNSLDDYYTILDNMGTACNMKANSDKLINEFKNSVAEFNKKLADAKITEDQKSRAIIIESPSASSTFVYGSAFLTGDLVTKAGGINVYDGAMGRLGVEDILKLCLDPDNNLLVDCVILFKGDTQTEADCVKTFTENPAYATLVEKLGTESIHAYNFAQLYMGGVLESDILDLIFANLYPEL
ncbi:MAG: hypothetical protein MJZ68_01120 [archaeon]|nr:hypothetical protein [archaeon]